MRTPYVWPYYYPQHQHPYFQYPPSPSAAESGFGQGYSHRPSMSWQGSPHMSPPVLPTLLPVVPAAPPVATTLYQPALLHPNYSQPPHSWRHSFDAAYIPVQLAAATTITG